MDRGACPVYTGGRLCAIRRAAELDTAESRSTSMRGDTTFTIPGKEKEGSVRY